jgi:RNA polymerase sigma factor (sigma-70 family)
MNENRSPAGFFEPTIWSTILKAKQDDEDTRRAAMERLLGRYRQPILRHIEASLSGDSRTRERAEDLTQEFIQQCLRLDFLKKVDPQQGLFRTFIKTCIRNFLRDQHARESAGKRGGGLCPLSLDQTDDEGNRLLDPAGPGATTESILDREWALSVMLRAMDALKRECIAARRKELFEALQGHLGSAPNRSSAAEIAGRLGMSEGAVHTATSRLKTRLGDLIREEIRQTVGTEQDWREELRYLIDLLGR